MTERLTIAVDAMGGDLGPRSTLPAALKFARHSPDVDIILVGDTLADNGFLLSSASPPSNLSVLHASDVVTMRDKPAVALRHKQQSSMWKAIELVSEGVAQACVSAGNTGALMAMGRFLLKTFPGIDRPAICKPVLNRKGFSLVLDLGANVDCTAEQLVQFALMGSVLAGVDGLTRRARVGLLNIGAEDIKGNEQIRLAASLLKRNEHINYVGFVEGDGIFAGDVDVIVCDGFVGNVALKASEGVAILLTDQLRELLSGSLAGRLAGQIARPLLRKWHTKFDPARYNGASFLGLQGIVVKSHGGADQDSFGYALQAAKEQAVHNVPQRINQQVADCLV